MMLNGKEDYIHNTSTDDKNPGFVA